MDKPIRPESQDFDEVERKYGKPKTEAEQAERYRLAQATRLLRWLCRKGQPRP